jgi:membrane peptidoglycan carboxypeptidase
MRYGTAAGAITSPALLNRVAGKTGTSDGPDDLWFTGSMSDVSVAGGGDTASFWMGYPQAEITISGMTSRDIAKLWARYMLAAPHTDKPGNIAQ